MADQYKILVADDDQDIADLIAQILRADNHCVLTANDGAEAVQAALREHPDLVIIDLKMPRTDGFEAIRQMRQQDAMRHMPIIVLTANSDEGSAAKGFAGGADDFLVKPFVASHLRARVTTWLLRQYGDRTSG